MAGQGYRFEGRRIGGLRATVSSLSREGIKTRNFCCFAGSNLRAKILSSTICRSPKGGGVDKISFLT